MIESIYSNDSKGSNNWGKTNVMFRMPKNIRQIGQADDSKKIYIEDYVMTYVRQLAMKDYSNYKIAVLLGQFIKVDGVKNIFISGAVEASNVDIEKQSAFSNETWTDIYDDVKKYFDDVEIVGWYVAKPSLTLEASEQLMKAHIDNFAGQDKTLLMFDSIEKEEAFYIYENSSLSRQTGYYIYYEKNEEMQNYMVDRKTEPSIEEGYEDRAIKEIRHIIEGKKENKQEKEQGVVHLLYGASTLLAVVVLVIGATMLNNYDQMKSIEKTLGEISDHVIGPEEEPGVGEDVNLEEATPTMNNMKEDKVTEVETISGNIEKMKEEQNTIEDNEKAETIEAEKATTSGKNTSGKNTSGKNTSGENTSGKETTADSKEEETESKGTKSEETESEEDKPVESRSTKNTEAKETVKPEVHYYTIKKGDSLITISMKFYKRVDKVDAILKANKLEDKDKILVGQKIIIP